MYHLQLVLLCILFCFSIVEVHDPIKNIFVCFFFCEVILELQLSRFCYGKSCLGCWFEEATACKYFTTLLLKQDCLFASSFQNYYNFEWRGSITRKKY